MDKSNIEENTRSAISILANLNVNDRVLFELVLTNKITFYSGVVVIQ